MGLPYFEVDVPIKSTDQPGLRGVHVFTGPADSRSSAVRIAHEVYDAARAAQEAGFEIPGKRPDGWGARGYRPGWEPDWLSATAGRWNDPCSWLRVSDFDL
ncbi:MULTISPECIES: hypothetical protein [Streptomyces]|uniref:Uncharacterized protein n=1 Tax=Streptomyces dengpaensis TaxID=2049881 RepID=A0ABM6T482_9ACTN|nr:MULTISPECIES: hypothetical protein [Streptomyces]AVH61885.1 hypothetical protein C4B68_40705 [Streptomyces dengpaensis]PIB04583.1 hypothetical protein B1C81_32765 [Streptomyces sp. HG99]